MKIAINTRFLLRGQLEGIGRYTYEICRRLVEDHPEDEFLFLFDRPYDPHFVFGPNVRPIVVFPPVRHAFLYWFWYEIKLARVLKKYKPDVFFSPDGYLCSRTKVPQVVTLHDLAHIQFPENIPYWIGQFIRHFVPKYVRKAAFVATVSQYSRKMILQEFNLPEDRVVVTYNGPRNHIAPLEDEAKMQFREQYTQGLPYFLFVGSIHPRKNVQGLIKAFDLFKKETASNTRLLVVGRKAWQVKEVQQAYEASAYQADIQFLGFQPDEELPRIYGAALALVFPSFIEGFGIPILEAMQAEVPVICSNTTSLPEVAGKAALLIDPSDPAEINKAMVRLFRDQDLQDQLVRHAKTQREKFSWPDSAKILYGLLAKASNQ